MRIFNSLTRRVEEFKPQNPPRVALYTCGPTVYDYPTIGNWRTYTLSDLLFRTLTYLGYQVDYVMNLTDVGHLTSDADSGEDKLEKGARREGKTAWEVAKFYSDDFSDSFSKLNLMKPKLFSKATDHIKEQIELVGKIEKAGFAYRIDDGLDFDVTAYEKAGNTYGELSNLEEIKAGARVEVNPQKKDPRDFALWKFSPAGVKRDMEWDSPWGVGFPGWHIECSAMSMKYLGEQLDVHVGGEDLKSIHHPNEIAQSEAATGKKPFSRYWVHGAFLTIDGGRMGKSLGNAYNLDDIVKRGFDPLTLRYFFLTGHYRKQINFTWEALAGAQTALDKLRHLVVNWGEPLIGCAEYEGKFKAAIENDLNLPEALAIVWEMAKSDYPGRAKKASLLKFDEVLGLGLAEARDQKSEVGEEAKKLLEKREELRKARKFEESDAIRDELAKMGYKVMDTDRGAKLVRE
ncbi:MAG: cysteine--tRNA ligase [Patescibacteria group bacterium]